MRTPRTPRTPRTLRAPSSPRALLALALCLLLGACSRYELELYFDGRANLDLTFDWLSRYGEQPEGMTVMMAHDGDTIKNYDVTHSVTARHYDLHGGQYYITTMNRTFGEYSTMRFFQRNSHNDIYAQANTYYIANEQAWDHGRTYMDEPERIGVATDTINVPATTDEYTFYNYRDHAAADTVNLKRHEVVLPMTTKLFIRVKVRGISYMRQGGLEGYITGMADGFYLNQRWRRREVGTLKLANWARDYDEEARRAATETESNVGWLCTTVETFGLPHGRELLRWRTPESNYILLHFTLLDGRTKDFAYLVGKDIRYRGDDGVTEYFAQTDVTLELNLEIDTPTYDNDDVPILPYSQPEGSGQFDAEVAPWGDDEDVDVPFF